MDCTAEPATLIALLAETSTRVEAVARRLSAAQLTAPPTLEACPPNEILWHVRATAGVYGEHIIRIVNEDSPRWRRVSPRARMKKVRYDQLPFADSSAAFALQRTGMVALLASIAPGAWPRIALVWHPRLPPPTAFPRPAKVVSPWAPGCQPT
ncbi:DinB family protein [bacterium]|nr:MAG: DinB family protein [bacterium]